MKRILGDHWAVYMQQISCDFQAPNTATSTSTYFPIFVWEIRREKKLWKHNEDSRGATKFVRITNILTRHDTNGIALSEKCECPIPAIAKLFQKGRVPEAERDPEGWSPINTIAHITSDNSDHTTLWRDGNFYTLANFEKCNPAVLTYHRNTCRWLC